MKKSCKRSGEGLPVSSPGSPLPASAGRLLTDVRGLIEAARQQVARAVNAGLVTLYWHVGRRIRQEILGEERAAYGEQIVSALSTQLTAEYGRGFDRRNLFHMVRFAEVFPDEQIVYALRTQLTWTHFRELIAIDDPLKREFYAEMCRAERWSTRTLQDQIKRMVYERTAVSKKPEEVVRVELAALRDEDRLTPDLVFRNPYFLDFLGLPQRYQERDLEEAILRELEAFLMELGTDFAFIARQKRITVDYEDYYLDLLFYHRRLRRLVAIDLKIGRFQAADKGQMELYLRWLEKHETHPDEEPPIGLILCPEHIQQAEWERRMKQPQGYPMTPGGEPDAFLESERVPYGIRCHNAWRKPKSGGRGPSLERLLKQVLARFGGREPDAELMVDLLDFFKKGSFLASVELAGARDKTRLLQVNEEVVRLQLATEEIRTHCDVCGSVLSGASPNMPCPRCHGTLVRWLDREVNASRSVKRIKKPQTIPLVAKEHTAQITTDDRLDYETAFKAPAAESKVNVLACSPTLEMGIDVGGLDAVVMRNIPPRPDNYAQRGGRAGRRSRVGLVLGYARSTPHDQYFYDKPREMIAGEVPAPAVSLGNRDVLVRHLYAIVFGAAEPGLAGRMVEYVKPSGDINQEAVDVLIAAVKAQSGHALAVARQAWGEDVLGKAGLDEAKLLTILEKLSERIQYVVNCTARQVLELRQPVVSFAEGLQKGFAAVRAGQLINRLLGIPVDDQRGGQDADDRSAGYPLRRLAEFGILPGYEFPSQPAALRLLGDPHEEDPISVTRRFGIGQFQPEAHVYARSKRWKVIGLDMASPWNPRSEGPTWSYRVCEVCDLRYSADEPKCPRCATASPGQPLPSYELAGFVALTDESPILDEEERYAERNLVRTYPQWGGDVVARWTVGSGWALRLSRNEEVRWVNEGKPPSPKDVDEGFVLHESAKGYLVCPTCGRMLRPPEPDKPAGGRRNAKTGKKQDDIGHTEGCPRRGSNPAPLAISTAEQIEVLRLLVPVPALSEKGQWTSWGMSLGYSLLAGMQHFFMLGAGELDFELEGPWQTGDAGGRYGMLSLAFIDPSLGGSGYLVRIAEQFHKTAEQAIEHLDHPDCETACYRCLKSYYNQRYHQDLKWPQIMPALEELSGAAPQHRPRETGDIDDPRPWLEAYAAGVGSPLELAFLRLFESHGFQPQKQVPIAPNPGEPPISIADFAVPERRLAIYIDGAAFHVGQRLRRDRFIRERLRKGNQPWRVEEFRAADLAQGVNLVARLKEAELSK